MYLYFDNNGILKEIVDDVATRKGNNEVNKIYIYVDGITPKTEWITYQTSDGVQSNETLIETTITKTIPYDRNRDLKYFKNFQEYLFYVATIPSNVLAVSGLTKASVRVALQDDSLMTLGLIIFTIEDSVVLQDSFITESQYQYLLNIISNFEELNNTGVIGISTQIVNGAVSPYDQGRIVLSTYNDNFTIATVVKSSAGQSIYNVLDMTFVKQVPYNNSNPNLEGLEINGKRYKVAYNTSQLTNDAGFITNAVSNLINYYTKTTIDEKFANIDFSDYYTKTESDGRYVLTTNFSWNNLANKPTSLSDFINDEGFITNTVSNLTNYYDKTTIDNIVATLKKGAFQVVSELPSTGAEGIVYLVGTEAPYTMYIWENNTFLNIGTTEVNLDGYVKGTNLNANYVVLGNGGSNVIASIYTINNQNANDPNSLLTANVINTLLGTKQDVLTQGQGIKISDDVISTPVSTTPATISQESVNKLKYDGKPILVDYAINDDSGRNIVATYATFDDVHALDIGDITSSSNIYQTLYQNVYENDTTKKNVVIFSTEGFVDSATSLIGSGDHIATPYHDNQILIDSVFVLNSDNSATTIISSDTVVIDLGNITEDSGTLSPDVLSEINNAISENKNIVLKANSDLGIILPNIVYVADVGLYASSFLSTEATTQCFTIVIMLSSGQYMFYSFGIQEKLLSGTNIKTINNQSILGEGNIEIDGSNFKIIDLTSSSRNNSISSLYNEITQVVDAEPPTFSNQSEIYNNIATAVNDGLVPILKFTDGYGYYKEYIESSNEYIFTINHIILNSEDTNLTNNVIILKVGNTQNSGDYNNLSQIPYTIVIQDAFSDSGSINNLDEMVLMLSGIGYTHGNRVGGLYLYNVAEKQLYNIYSLTPQATGSNAMLEAYTIINNKIVYIKFTAGQGRYDYTKTTYALGGGGESNTVIIDLGTITNINTNTPAFTLSSDEKTAIDEAYNNNKIVYVKFNYVNENDDNETVILPIESKVNQVGGSYIYYGGGTLQNHVVWSFSISSTSVFVNNISNTHRTKLFDLGTLSQLTGTLSNATEIANAFNSGYTPIIKFTYNNTTYYFTEPSGKYNSSSNTGSLSWISILSDKTVEKFTLNYPGRNYILSNEELGGGGESDTVVIDLGTLSTSASGGTLSSEILSQITSNLGNKNITFKANIDLGDGYLNMVSQTYQFVSGNFLAISMTMVADVVYDPVSVIAMIISLQNGTYATSTIYLPREFKTINGQSIVGAGNISTGLPAQQYTISQLDFTNFSEGQSVNISASDSAIIENARTNQASVIYNEVNLQYLPILYVETADDVQVLYNDLLGHCGIVSINTTNNTATVLSVFNTDSKSTINLNTISNTKTNYDNVFNYLVDQGFARAYFNVEGFLDQENGIGNEQYYEAYLSGENMYFSSCGKIYQYIVDTSTQGFHVELVGNSLFRPISKNTLRFDGSILIKISPTSTLTTVSILLGANVSKGGRKYTFDNPRMNFQFRSTFDNSFAFNTTDKEINIEQSIYPKLFTWHGETTTIVPTVSSTRVSTWYPTNWHEGKVASQNMNATILDFSNLPSGTTYNEFFGGFYVFPTPIYYKFINNMDKYQEYRTFRFSLRFVFDYQGVAINSGDQLYYDKKWTGTLQNRYLEVIARLDFTNKQVVIYQRIRRFA